MHQEQLEAGLKPHARHTPSSCKSRFESKEEETSARNDAVTGLIQLMRRQLPVLLKRLVKIPDPRNPNKLKYKLTVLMIYGILVFVFQYGSRRAANGEITRPVFEDNLRTLFPELETLPHADTLFRLLCRIDVNQIEQAHVKLVNHLIRGKKFTRYLVNNCYPVAIDGSQKIAFSTLWDEHLLQRKSKRKAAANADEEPDYQYYVYVLEASLSFRNGMVIP
ncbi:MAG: transposase family protein, partial [Gammaproteobacteria bacterium]|nr:transposase family protein [Gammaproteobacteria bacterium]